MLGTGEACFTDADLDCPDFPFLLIAPNESRLVERFAAALTVDAASYILRGGSFWLTKPGWGPLWGLSVLSSSHVTVRTVISY